ncbi:hypothetical protein MMC09_001459 [Bachmanniomyces sp. S44760]|nr:hypothetical protein [Bachmanniomyces sp. S44760]
MSVSSRGLADASQEVRLLRNLPAYDNSQGVLNAIDRLTIVVESLRTDVHTLRTEVTTLRTDFNHRFDNFELRLQANSYNQVAQIYNSHISNSNIPLRGLHDHRNMAVNGFPIDSATLKRLQAPALTALLEAFQLPSDGSLGVKRQRFREFVGLVVDV